MVRGERPEKVTAAGQPAHQTADGQLRERWAELGAGVRASCEEPTFSGDEGRHRQIQRASRERGKEGRRREEEAKVFVFRELKPEIPWLVFG